MKIIQLNIFLGTYTDNLISFLLDEKPDLVTMQEVTPEAFQIILKKTNLCGYLDKTTPFRELKNHIFLGNAVLTRGKIITRHVVRLNEYIEIGPLAEIKENELEKIPRSLLDAKIEMGKKHFHIISAQLAVRADRRDSPKKIRQAEKFSSYIKSLGEEPFIIGADFNAIPDSRVIKIINKVAQNSFDDFPIERTTHPTFHKTKDFIPAGLVIDYIYTSRHFQIKSLRAPVIDVSDHLPLIAEMEFKER